MMGPGPRRRGAPMPRMSWKGQGKILKRLMGIILKKYGFHYLIVLICILISSFCTLQGTLFTQTLIDDHILPLLATVQAGGVPDYTPLAQALLKLACILLLGIGKGILFVTDLPGQRLQPLRLLSGELVQK